jgi:hypothetical protein
MDLQNAALLIAAVTAATAASKDFLPESRPKWVTRLVSLVIALVAIFVLRETAWANEQVIGGKVLDKLDTWSVIFAGFMIALGSNILDRALNVVSNIGENNNAPPQG